MKGMGYCVEMFPYSPASATAILFQFYKVFIARIIRKVDKIDFEKFLKSCMYVWHICFQLSKKVFIKNPPNTNKMLMSLLSLYGAEFTKF